MALGEPSCGIRTRVRDPPQLYDVLLCFSVPFLFSRAAPSNTCAKSSFPRNSCRPHHPGNSSEKLWGHLATTLATKLGAALKPGALPPSSHNYSARDRGEEALPAQTRAARTERRPRTLSPEPPAVRPHRPRGRRAQPLTGLQQMSASVSGSLTRVHSLVRKAGTLLGPAAPGPTGRSIPGETGEEEVATAKRGRGTG